MSGEFPPIRKSSDKSCCRSIILSAPVHGPMAWEGGEGELGKMRRGEGKCGKVRGKGGEKRTNWPWMSPQTVTGHLTGWTFDSSIKISRAFFVRVRQLGPEGESAGAHLVAQSLHVQLRELFAVGKVSDPYFDAAQRQRFASHSGQRDTHSHPFPRLNLPFYVENKPTLPANISHLDVLRKVRP